MTGVNGGVNDLRAFLIARVAEREASGDLSPVEGITLRREIVRHAEKHVCGDAEYVDDPEDTDEESGPLWCDWLRDLGVQYRGHPDFQERWLPYEDPYWEGELW